MNEYALAFTACRKAFEADFPFPKVTDSTEYRLGYRLLFNTMVEAEVDRVVSELTRGKAGEGHTYESGRRAYSVRGKVAFVALYDGVTGLGTLLRLTGKNPRWFPNGQPIRGCSVVFDNRQD